MKRKNSEEPEPRKFYGCNPDIVVFYELEFNGHTIKPGTIIKFKNVKGTFKFYNMAHNIKKDVQWIDCMENGSGNYRAFYIDQLKGVVVPKKSRRKKSFV